MIKNRFVHFNSFTEASTVKFSANEADTSYITVLDNGRKVSSVVTGTPDITFTTISFIKDTQTIITHGQVYLGVDTLPDSDDPDNPMINQEVLVEVDELPEASEDTLNKIYYIIDPSASGVPYAKKYITVFSDDSYVWDEFTISSDYIKEVILEFFEETLLETITELIDTKITEAIKEAMTPSVSNLVGSEINQTDFTCPIELEDNQIHTVLCVNNTTSQCTLTFDPSLLLPSGKENKLTVEPNTYSEISFMKISGVIYVRYL